MPLHLFPRLISVAYALVLAMGSSLALGADYQWKIFAGTLGGIGNVDGIGNAARFYRPCGVAVDQSGNVYVADTRSHTIRKITSAGLVSTLAGAAGKTGHADGTGSEARFLGPRGVVIDSHGSVYVADTFNHTIRKISSAGIVTTLAGRAGKIGSADGSGSEARFNTPQGLAVDESGNIYVADTASHTIRKISGGEAVTTLAGSAGNKGSADGTASAARFDAPGGVAVDGHGNVYVVDDNNHTIRKITSAGLAGC
ncbi:MAG: hypothetical protein V4710_23370 [Verrucomicrobiota bacterium]